MHCCFQYDCVLSTWLAEATNVMDWSVGSELPRFILCPNCNARYNDDKKRRVIDSCGHPRCFSCLSKDEVCSLCERNKNLSNMQKTISSEKEKNRNERSELEGKIRSMSAMMERSLSCGAELRRRKAKSFSKADDSVEKNGDLSVGTQGDTKCGDDSSKCLSTEKENEPTSETTNSKIKINVSAKKIDRKASFSSVLSRNSESFKHFRRSSSFSTSNYQKELNTETQKEFQSHLRIPSKPRPHSLGILEYERWNEAAFRPTESNEHAESAPRILQFENKRRKSLENVLKRATSWLEESKNTLNDRSRLLFSGNASCKHAADMPCGKSGEKAKEPHRMDVTCEAVASSNTLDTNNESGMDSHTLENGNNEFKDNCSCVDSKFDIMTTDLKPPNSGVFLSNEEPRLSEEGTNKAKSGPVKRDTNQPPKPSVNLRGNNSGTSDAFKATSTSDERDSTKMTSSSFNEDTVNHKACSSVNNYYFNRQEANMAEDPLRSAITERNSENNDKQRSKGISKSCDDIYEKLKCSSPDDDYDSSSDGSDFGQSLSWFDSTEDESVSDVIDIDEQIDEEVFQKDNHANDASYLPAIRQLLYGKCEYHASNNVARASSPRRNGTHVNPFLELSEKRVSRRDLIDTRLEEHAEIVENKQHDLGNYLTLDVPAKPKPLKECCKELISQLQSKKGCNDCEKETNSTNTRELLPSNNKNINNNNEQISSEACGSMLEMRRALAYLPLRNDVRVSNEAKEASMAGNKDVLYEGAKKKLVDFASKTDAELDAEQNYNVQTESNSQTQTESSKSKGAYKRPGYHKSSWSTSDLNSEIQYLPSLKKNRRKRPNSFNNGHIEWYPRLIPEEIDVDSFCEESFNGEDLVENDAGLNLEDGLNNVDISRDIEQEKGKSTQEATRRENISVVSSNVVMEVDDKLKFSEARYDKCDGKKNSDGSVFPSQGSGNIMVFCDESASASHTIDNEVFLQNNETALNHEYNIIDGLKIERNSEGDKAELSSDERIQKQQIGDIRRQTGSIASCSVVAKDDKSIHKPSKFSHLKQKRFDDISRNKINRYSLPDMMEGQLIHDDDLIKNRTDDWKTANSHFLKINKENLMKTSDSFSQDISPVVFVADNDLNEPNSGINKPNNNKYSKHGVTQVKNPIIGASAVNKVFKSKANTRSKERKKDTERSRHVSMPHGMKFIRDKIHRLTKWSKRGSCLENETSVNINEKSNLPDKNSVITDQDINQNFLGKHPKQAHDSCTMKIKPTTMLDYKASNGDKTEEEYKQQTSDDKTNPKIITDVPQGSSQGPLFAGKHNQSIVEAGVTNETDQASLTSVSTLNGARLKLDFIDSDESSILSSDSDDSTISSKFSMFSDSDSSSDTINTSVKDVDMPDFRSPSRIQEDLAVLLEKKVTRRRQGLNEIDFHSLMLSSRGKSMISREWLYDIVYQLLLANESQTSKTARGLIICAKNGCGKTSFLKSMIWKNQEDRLGSRVRERITNSILSYHFCLNSDVETTSVAKFVLNMAANLVDNDEFSFYTKTILENNEISNCLNSESVERDPEKAFRDGILKPLNCMFKEKSNNISDNKQYLFIIDINDHCCKSCKVNECVAALIAHSIDLIPKRMKFVIAGKKKSVQKLQDTGKLHEVSLDNIKNWDVQRDIYSFTETLMQKVFVGDISKARIRKLIDNVVKFSQGSFDIATMAIHYVTGYYTSMQKMPSLLSLDINQLFQEIIKLKFGCTERERILAISLLDILYVSQEPFTLSNLYKAVENGCSSQAVTYQEFECCIETLVAVHMISENVEGRFSITEITRNCLVDYREKVSNSTLRKGHNLLSLYYMKMLNNSSGKHIYRLAYHLASSNFGEEIEHEEGRVNFLAWTFSQVFKNSTSGFMEPCNIYHPRTSVYHLFLHTDIDMKMFARSYGKDPLVLASTLQQTPIVKLLLTHKQYSKEMLDAALKEAIKNGSSQIVDLLLQRKVDQSVNNASYFDTALESNQLSIAIRLLQRDWPLDQQNIKKEAAQKTVCEACNQGDLEIIKQLVKRKGLVDLNKRDNSGRLAIVCAVGNGHVETVKFLIKNGASTNNTDEKGNSPLLKAVLVNNEEMVDLIIDEDCEIDMSDKSGRTPLMIAALHNRCRLIDTMFMEGASLVHQDENGLSALAIACMNGATKAIRLLLKNRAAVDQTDKAERTPLHHACVSGNAESVQVLMNYGANINHKDLEGYKPIERALISENFKVVNNLLKNNATVRKTSWALAERNLASFLCLINYFERKGSFLIKNGQFFEANSYFKRVLNKIETSKYRNNKKVQRIEMLCQRGSKMNCLSS